MINIFCFVFAKKDERQVRLREHARRLIAETRARSLNMDSPTSPNKLITQRITLSPERTISPINTAAPDISSTGGLKSKKETSPGKRVSPPRPDASQEGNSSRTSPARERNSPLQSFNSVLERVSPQREKKVVLERNFFMYFFKIIVGNCLAGAIVVHRERTGGVGTRTGVNRSEG